MQASQDPVSLPVGPGTEDAAAALQQQMADLVAEHTGAATVFGDPITADSITIIPVARARLGFGAAAGSVGGGTDVRPLGYIEISHGITRYRPIRAPWIQVVVPLTAMAAGLAAPWIIRSANTLRRIRHR
ncbi:hypothetical protein [Nocardia sp. NPDC057440]|uniref:hypothetical protein n=1 Tax=Nocardia sp. NPDC057440 TaxID=3346134 RepID=UPI00366EB180